MTSATGLAYLKMTKLIVGKQIIQKEQPRANVFIFNERISTITGSDNTSSGIGFVHK